MRTVTKGKKYKCLECTGYEQSLTIGKDYTALENDEGNSPTGNVFITAQGDNGKLFTAHIHRFEEVKE